MSHSTFCFFFFLVSLFLCSIYSIPFLSQLLLSPSIPLFLPAVYTRLIPWVSSSLALGILLALFPTQQHYLKSFVTFPRPSRLVLSLTNVLTCTPHSLSIHAIFPKYPILFSGSLYSSYSPSSQYILFSYTVPLSFILPFLPVVSCALVFCPNSLLSCFLFQPVASSLSFTVPHFSPFLA